MSVLGRCTQADRKFLAVLPERYAMTCRVWRSHRRGQLHMDRLVIFLDVDLAASRVSDKTRAPDLVKVRMVADDEVHACKMRADVASFKPIRSHICGHTKKFPRVLARLDSLNNGATEYGKVNVHAEQHTDAQVIKLVHWPRLRQKAASFRPPIRPNLAVINPICPGVPQSCANPTALIHTAHDGGMRMTRSGKVHLVPRDAFRKDDPLRRVGGDFIGSQNHRYGYTHGGFWGCQIADIKFGDALHVWSRLCHPSPSASSGSNPPLLFKRRKIERPTRKKSSAQGRNASAHDRRGQRVCVGPDRDHDERWSCPLHRTVRSWVIVFFSNFRFVRLGHRHLRNASGCNQAEF